MKHARWFGGVAAAAMMMGLVGNAMALETAPHKGWFVGGGVLGGGEFVRGGAAATSQNRFGGGALARFGYGISDKVLISYDNGYLYSRKSGQNFNTYDGQVRLQLFPIGNFFAATGAGVAIGQVLQGVGTSTKTGLSTTTSLGYEIRPTEKMGISIEGGYNYKRLGGLNHHSPIVAARLDWYFY